jgi:acid phosphatase (class A)
MHVLSFRLPWLLLVALSLSGLPAAASGDKSHSPSKKWYWLSEGDKDRLLKAFPPKPEPGSSVDQADLQGVLQAQASRTPADIAEAMADKNFNMERVSNALGAGFTKKNFPVTFALLDRVNQDEYLLNVTLKNQNMRKRPYQEHPEVKELFQVDQYSYPSGHSSGAHTFADILSLLFPDKKDALTARADAVGHSRVVAGVHYPSDVEQGKNLAQELTDALVANAAFQESLAAAKAEVARQNSLITAGAGSP